MNRKGYFMQTAGIPPVLTVIISLGVYNIIPHPIIICGMLLAILSAYLMGVEETKIDRTEEKASLYKV